MREIRLDFLANPSRNFESSSAVNSAVCAFSNSFDSEICKKNNQFMKNICRFFEREHLHFFNSQASDFLALFANLDSEKIAVDNAFSHAANLAAKFLKLPRFCISDFCQNLQDFQNLKYFFAPFMSDEILGLNDIENFALELKKRVENCVIFVEISAVLKNAQVQILQKLCKLENVAFVINAQSLGLSFGGAILHSDSEIFSKLQAHNFFSSNLAPNGFFESFASALDSVKNDENLREYVAKNYNVFLFENLKQLLGDKAQVFAPIENCFGNALALRLQGAKARLMAQNLIIQNVVVINGVDCMLGNFAPSYVLENLGFDDLSRRELLSISFAHISRDELAKTAQKIAQSYKNIFAFGL